jgi:hypothetical protein
LFLHPLPLFLSCHSLTADGAVEDILAELNAKSPEERQKVIVENAKKEGEVTLYRRSICATPKS